jgi:tRNA(fMet)-specific endonuclease VapC
VNGTRYLLDANVIISLLDEPAGIVARRVRSHRPAAIGLSAIAIHELYFGASGAGARSTT